MAHNRETAMFNPSSPHSSIGGAESFKGTPDTRLTAFSPEEGSARSSRFLKSMSQDSLGATPSRFSTGAFSSVISTAERDPFITASSVSGRQKLSPTASAFQPFSSPLDRNTDFGTPDHNQESFSPDRKYETALSRCLNIGSPNRNLGMADLNACFSKLHRLGLLVQEPIQVQCKGGKLSIQFSDIRDAVLVHDNVHRAEADFEAEYLSNGKLSEHIYRVPNKVGPWLSLVASATPLGLLDVNAVAAVVKRMLQSQGQLSAFYVHQDHDPSVFKAFVQFEDPSKAMSAVDALDNRVVEGAHMTVSLVDAGDLFQTPQDTKDITTDGLSHSIPVDLTSALQALALSKPAPQMHLMGHAAPISGPTTPYSTHGIQVPPFAMWPILCQPQFQPSGAYVLNDGHRLPQPPLTPNSARYQLNNPMFIRSSRSMSTTGSFHSGVKGEPRRQNAARVNRSPYYNVASHHNHVDVNRIREGTDVRTTIMLRNIPNKVDQAMLKRIVDESSWGKYDFMYLRIDFANDCNVGYAFINFVDPLDIIDFVNTRGNQRWNCFKSDKVAEISYATIQGKDCLVQKFRNSSVMLEAAHYRPKLFYTSNGPVPDLAGEEEPFPLPDNQSKMKRSCENAEHVGLFTPNAGQHFRDEQRRRRSQYDRGTRLAALEEHDFEASMQPYMYHSQ
ncbi:Meiosis protein mei2 [Colletotrichum tanaceti]|uniref:Meiosis protein mei2 n=1 Tax=Colletotrichum tanaceti TaxID=1306861 RepID=A0A4U6XUK6_9PEZI|nr:Meiosis protein mei2 [Colletotrichum tanaceti]TKW59608.1 Meiosis protein mei2 [Colletotrichum tanaceti]